MGFRVYCDITYKDEKGKDFKCRQEMEPCIDKDTGVIYCECGKEMTNQDALTSFAKRQMIALGQVRKPEKKRQAYSVQCPACKKEGPPQLNKTKQLICSYCSAEMTHLNKPFAEMLKQNLIAQKRANQ